MDFAQLINHITPDIHQRLKRAIEMGKWPDGRVLTQEQKELTLQAVISYEGLHLSEAERVGYIDRGHKVNGEVCDNPQTNKASSSNMPDEHTPLKWS